MKLKKLKESFENLFAWDKEEIENKSNEIEELMSKLLEKKASLENKIKKEKNKDEKIDLENKLKAINKLIKKAKKNLF